MGFLTIFNQIEILGILALCGIIAYRFKIVHNSAKRGNWKTGLLHYFAFADYYQIIEPYVYIRYNMEWAFYHSVCLFDFVYSSWLENSVLNYLGWSAHKQPFTVCTLCSGILFFWVFLCWMLCFQGGSYFVCGHLSTSHEYGNVDLWSVYLNPASKEKGLKNLEKL